MQLVYCYLKLLLLSLMQCGKVLCNHPYAILPMPLSSNISRTLLNSSCCMYRKLERFDDKNMLLRTKPPLHSSYLWYICVSFQGTKAKPQNKEVTSEFISFSSYIYCLPKSSLCIYGAPSSLVLHTYCCKLRSKFGSASSYTEQLLNSFLILSHPLKAEVLPQLQLFLSLIKILHMEDRQRFSAK